MGQTQIVKVGAFDNDIANQLNAMLTELYAGAGLAAGTPLGTAAAATVAVSEKGNGIYRQTVLTLTALAMALSDANVGGGSKIYTFPQGNITILGATAVVAETTTSAILTTLNGGKTLSAGVGSVQTVAQASGTLVTTEQDIVNAFAPVSSTVINVAAAAAAGKLSATTLTRYDGSVTPQAIYLNCGVPTATDIDGDATTTWSGTITIDWMYNGLGA
jgi:hypothetical protein